jgi:hypothetical protein
MKLLLWQRANSFLILTCWWRLVFNFFFSFLSGGQCWSLNSLLLACKADTLSLEPCLQALFLISNRPYHLISLSVYINQKTIWGAGEYIYIRPWFQAPAPTQKILILWQNINLFNGTTLSFVKKGKWHSKLSYLKIILKPQPEIRKLSKGSKPARART